MAGEFEKAGKKVKDLMKFHELKLKMSQKLAYYFDTDEHDPITPEIIAEWMNKSYKLGKKVRA